MHLDNRQIKEILTSGNYVEPEDLAAAEKYSAQRHVPLTDYLFTKGLLSTDILGQAIAEYHGMTFADLSSAPPARDQVLRIPEDVAREYRAVLYKEEKKRVVVATDEPTQGAALKSVLKKTFAGKTVEVAFALARDMDLALTHYRQELGIRFTEIMKTHDRVAPQLFEAMVDDALAAGASDIHIEPQDTEVVVRFRVDGILHEVGRIPKPFYEGLLNRIKVQARLRIDEHTAAQDGAIRFEEDGSWVDMRVSIVPTLDGEKVAIRLLSHYVRSFTLADLGLSEGNQELLLKAAKMPFGMILVVGPTGSGKSTTLYALIKYLSRPEINITTIEDPVEYKMAGINQIQVNPLTNLTFAEGLKSIVRQDPNIILVGEIRDTETSEIAVNAALTGHLLFSTFHANDAATAIPRLLDMNVEPFLLSSTLNLVLAQRLVRKICERCRYAEKMTHEDMDKVSPVLRSYFPDAVTTVYRGKGKDCPLCNGTGYKGRTAVFECVFATPEMKELILTHPTTQETWALAKSQGARTLFEDGIEKVKSGITTIEEVFRVAAPPAASHLKQYETKSSKSRTKTTRG